MYALLGIAFFIWAQHRKGGFELLQMEFFYGQRFFLMPNESP
jgi:hypothetical protein